MADDTGPVEGQVVPQKELEEMLYARHVEIKSLKDLEGQRGTPIPALFNLFYKFIQNPSSVSVETFKRMVDTDDTIGSGVDFLTMCLASRLGRYEHPSKEITELITKALSQISGGFYNAVKELLSASWSGFAVQEKVWKNDPNLGFVPDKLVSLPPSTLLFETERTGEITSDGILQYQRYFNPMGQGFGTPWFSGAVFGAIGSNGFTGFRPDAYAKLGDMPFPIRTANSFNYLSIRIPRQKCIHYSFDAQGKFGNPYGRSLLRRIYKYYVMKDAFLQMLAVALDRKGTPLLIVFADPNTSLRDPTKANGNVKGQSNKSIRADQAASDAFKNIHNDSVVVLPGKKDTIYSVDTVDVSNSRGEFLGALDFCNKSMMRGLLVPSLIFTNGDGSGSYALGQEHAKTFDKLCDGMLFGLKEVLMQDLISEIIRYNFPESAWKKDGFGSFGKRELTQDEVDKVMDTYEKAIDKGVVDQADLRDLNKMRENIGFEPRTKPIERPDPFGMAAEPGEGGEEDDDESEKPGSDSRNKTRKKDQQ